MTPETPHGPDADDPVDPQGLLDRLAARDVLAVDSTGGEIRLTDAFDARVESRREAVSDLDGDAIRADVEDVVDADGEVDALVESVEVDPDFPAEYLALAEAAGDLTHAERLRALALFDALRHRIPDDGSPDPFLPVRGERLPLLVDLYERTVVYVWRHECPPCDLVRESLESILVDPPGDLALLSVYGPDSAQLLEERYDVVGGPTVLFCYDDRVDARLFGAHAERILESEIETLREL